MIKQIDHGNVIHYGTDTLIIKSAGTGFGKPLCKKILHEEFPSAAILSQLDNEYEICSKINCSSIRKAYNKIKEEDHVLIELEYIEGKDLQKFLATEKTDLLQQLHLATDIATALNELQRENIFHRQVHPSNIIIEHLTHKVFFIDFSIAVQGNTFIQDISAAQEKQPEYLRYISPEQTGRINRPVDNRADLYSFGVILYKIFTGELPFDSNESLELIYAHVAKEPQEPRLINKNLPAIISNIILKLLSKNAEDRYQSAYGVKQDLEKCLQQYIAGNKIENFKPGQNDFSGKLFVPSDLFGREKEINLLKKLFDSSANGNKSTLFISGYSGSGKSALVETLQKPVLKKKGSFIKGKFDQISSGTPYSTFVQAFTELLQKIMTGDEQSQQYWKRKILDSLGNSVKILTEFIPTLEELVGKMPELPKLKGIEAQNRFNYEFVRFLKTIADKDHPLVIFVDDLQWADASSLNLFRIIAENRDIEFVMLIGAYRENEVDENHPLIKKIDELREENIHFEEISLKELLFEDVHTLVSAALLTGQDNTSFLSDLIYTKTKGNAFYIWQFLKSIYEERLLWFDFDTQRWQWNAELIMQMNVSGNVVELMTSYVQKLPAETLDLLETASAIGNRFERRTLSVIKQLNEKKVESLLNVSISEGLIIPVGSDYKFAHDRVQQAIYSLIPEEQKSKLHLLNGKKLTAHYNHLEIQEKIFEVVNQWNLGAAQLAEKKEKIYLANLNLQAGNKAMASAAYPQALQYFEKGIQVMDDDDWKDEYSLCHKIISQAADSAYLSAEYEKVDKYVNILLKNSRSFTDSIVGYEIDIKKLIAQNKPLDAVKLGLQILEKLNIRLPLNPDKFTVLVGLLKSKWLLRNKSMDYFNNLPEMKDENKSAAMRVLSDISSASYFAAPNLVPLLVFKMVSLTVQKGLSVKSPFGLSAYGYILSVFLKEREKGIRFGEIALNLAKRIHAEELIGSILSTNNLFLTHWKKTNDELKTDLEKAFKSSLEAGNNEWASYAAHNLVYQLLFTGAELHGISKKAESLDLQIEKFKQDLTLKRLRIFRQAIANLITENENPDLLRGEIFDETEIDLADVTKSNEVYFQNLYIQKLWLALIFNRNDQAKKYIEYAERFQDSQKGTSLFIQFYFFRAVAIADAALLSPEKKSVLKQIKKDLRVLKEYEKIAPQYNTHKTLLVQAEYHYIKGEIEKAKIYYDKALKFATENNMMNDLGFCWERAGQFFINTKQDLLAGFYLQNAYRAYKRWGADAKLKQMETRYPQLKSRTEITEWNPGAQAETRDRVIDIDLETILKASTAISGEIVLPKLLKKMMQIIMENAGAEKGFLIMEKNGERVIEAEITAGTNDLKVLHSRPVKQCGLLAESVVNYVNLTQESIMLDDARKNKLFANDPFIEKNNSKSVLCIPLINMGKIQAIIYLSNDLTYGVFTEDRISLLKLLAGQMAVSIENALFYNELENKVEERTNELYLEKKKSDDLLLNILPEEVATELKLTGRTTPRSYEVATVMFTDFENFTIKSEKLSPEELVSIIDTCFKKFDEIISRHNIEKIKTIGDAYLCVSGLPDTKDHDAENVVRAALEIIEVIKTFRQGETGHGYFDIRIGIHTGPLVAGVVGDKKFAYDIWGDTVNTAARMEQNSEPNKINISQSTYELVKEKFNCSFRGKQPAKNKGMIEMYFVEREK